LKKYEKDMVAVAEIKLFYNVWLTEQLKTTRNLCDCALLIIDAGQRQLLPTVLELLHEETQKIIYENCIDES